MNQLDRYNKPSVVMFKNMKFFIMDSPSKSNIDMYVKDLTRGRATACVRCCEPHYEAASMESAGIKMHEMEFQDGDPPSEDIIKRWLAVVDETFGPATAADKYEQQDAAAAIAVHCVAGLGRAPVLVAIALIEAGKNPFDAIQFIREKRRGAINDKQIRFLEDYVPRRKNGICCTIV
jgi:protein tyrosine phosphatase type IVA|eukprot:g2604.t1